MGSSCLSVPLLHIENYLHISRLILAFEVYTKMLSRQFHLGRCLCKETSTLPESQIDILRFSQ
jgi:hypothetical protein